MQFISHSKVQKHSTSYWWHKNDPFSIFLQDYLSSPNFLCSPIRDAEKFIESLLVQRSQYLCTKKVSPIPCLTIFDRSFQPIWNRTMRNAPFTITTTTTTVVIVLLFFALVATNPIRAQRSSSTVSQYTSSSNRRRGLKGKSPRNNISKRRLKSGKDECDNKRTHCRMFKWGFFCDHHGCVWKDGCCMAEWDYLIRLGPPPHSTRWLPIVR